jgi:hypothetical protein
MTLRYVAALCAVRAILLDVRAAGQVSEAYQYRIAWNGIPAADATITVVQEDGLEPATTRIRAHMRTNSFVDVFWSLRAESWAEFDADTLHLHHFEYDRRIDGRPEATRVEFEDDGMLTGRYVRPGRYHVIEINEPGVLDPMAAILRARRQLPAVGEAAVYEVFTGEARYRIELRRRPSETVVVPVGRFTAARLEPTIWKAERNQPDKRVRRVTLWVTDSAPHTLLRVRSEVFIGAVYADLMDWSCIGCTRSTP